MTQDCKAGRVGALTPAQPSPQSPVWRLPWLISSYSPCLLTSRAGLKTANTRSADSQLSSPWKYHEIMVQKLAADGAQYGSHRTARGCSGRMVGQKRRPAVH